jgi:predicted O-methyltransferase YrrM
VAQDTWTAVDEYVTGLLAPPDEALDAAVRAGEAAGLPQIQVSPPQGKLLHLLAKTIGATSILEFGTLAGYSTIWLARALPADGRLVTLEANPEYAEVASASIAAAGLGEVVEVRVGPALDQLPQLDVEGAGPFDLTFIDADKVHTPEYRVLRLGPGPLAPRQPDRRRQRRPRRPSRRPRRRRPGDCGPAPLPRAARH